MSGVMDAQTRLAELVALRARIELEIVVVRNDITRARKRRPVAQCGTESGYSRHLRTGEQTCDTCRRAHTDAEIVRAIARRNRRREGAA